MQGLRPAAAACLLLLGLAACGADRNERPDVFLVSIDTLRRDRLTLDGGERDATPHLAALAREAVVFEQAIAAQSSTAPSHASMLTGLYPPSHGLRRNRARLDDGVRTLGEILGGAGYRTAAFVSGFPLHHGHTGLERGFDHYDDSVERERRGAATLAAALQWLEGAAGSDAPVFVLLHLYDPHYSYNAPEPFASRFAPPGGRFRYPIAADLDRLRAGRERDGELDEYARRYDGEVAYADHAFGIFREALAALGRFEGSVVIVVSDHGETLSERPWVLDHGARVSEEQIRIPLLLRLPGGRAGGRRVATPVHHVDLLPTVLEIVGEPAPADLPGRSLLPLAEGTAPEQPDRALLSFALSAPRRVPEVPDLEEGGEVVALRAPPFKLVSHPTTSGPRLQLFDLASDPGERIDLARSRPQTIRALAERLAELRGPLGGEHPPAAAALDPEAEARLRALGYTE